MIDDQGARAQESLREHPAITERRNMNTILRGIIMPNGVRLKDQNDAKQTLVDIALLGGYPNIYGAVIATGMTNQNNGVEWTPQAGNLVLVGFINGNFSEPVVIGHLPLADDGKDEYEDVAWNVDVIRNKGEGSNVQANAGDVDTAPRYHFRLNNTDVQVDKAGNRITEVAGFEDEHIKGYRTTQIEEDEKLHVIGNRSVKIEENETLEVTGNGTLIIHGNLTVHIYGTATVNVDGDTTVTTPNATVHASSKITLDSPEVDISGKLTVQGDIKSVGGDVSDHTRSMQADRGKYNSHWHYVYGGTTSAPQIPE